MPFNLTYPSPQYPQCLDALTGLICIHLVLIYEVTVDTGYLI